MKREKILVACVVALIALLLVVIGFLMLRDRQPQEAAALYSNSGSVFAADANVITSRLSDEELAAISKAAQEEANRKKVSLEYQRGLEFDSAEATGTGYIANNKDNHYPMFFTVFVDNQEVIRTGLVPVGGYLDKFTLTSPLAKGTYEGFLVYNGVDEEKQEVATTSMAVVVDITVGN